MKAGTKKSLRLSGKMNKKNKPLISVVTPCLNRADLIERAIQSVLAQKFDSFEHIIIDGGSTDGTLALLKKYPHLKVFVGKDKGVYDAMNKGIAMAQGSYINLLNSDDFYANDCFQHIKKIDRSEEKFDILVGSATVTRQKTNSDLEITRTISSRILRDPLYAATFGVPIPNAWFIKRSVFEFIGSFNLNYSLIADRDFLIRCWENNVRFITIDAVLYNYFQHEGSLTISTDRIQRLKRIYQSIELSEKYIKSSNPDLKSLSEKWFIYLTGEGVKTSLRLVRINQAYQIAHALVKKNPMWTPQLIKECLTKRRRVKDQ